MKKDNLYNSDYPYKDHKLTTGISKKGYPIIERTNNALLFPEGPKDKIDTEEIKKET